MKRFLLGSLALVIATAIWIPSVHFFYQPKLADYYRPDGIAPKARELAARHLELWTDPQLRAEEIKRMRGSNAEWDFMGRTFLVLALANMSCREPAAKAQYLEVIDRIIDETLRLEKEKGMYFFLMNYARYGEWVAKPERSLFVDGEIALMLGARRLVEERADYKPLLHDRIEKIIHQMNQSPVLAGESYPDECWMFCNTAALAAIKISDVLDGTDHGAFLRQWIETAKGRLTDPKTGLLISSFSQRGEPKDGPEGSSIWMATHCLQVVDPVFAADQYARARKELGRRVCGFSYATEWPRSWEGPQDIDSGPVIPILNASAGSSGLAFLGACSFHDTGYLSGLISSLSLGGFPVERKGKLKYSASNQVGDAVLLYSLVCGPLWQKVEGMGQR
ncbi:MAG: hypothetical protein EXS18_03390 [Verrucomicrobiae bacterium]|nr:hypothetical protein [Verrucomicrobiae bacterium]